MLVRLNFVPLALTVVVLSKWRMFAVRPRFWAANVRANSVDILVGLAVVSFMARSDTLAVQLLWTVIYVVWLVFVKPGSTTLKVTAQAFVGQLLALAALYSVWGGGPVIGLTVVTGLICFLAARHFFDIFDEPSARLLSFLWGYFGAGLSWLLSHWLLYYHGISQPTVLLSVLGYGLALLYYFDHDGRLNRSLQRQILLLIVAAVVVVLAFSDWGNKIV